MKKMIAMLLALCLMAMLVPGLAEPAGGESSSLDALLDLAGTVLDGSDGAEADNDAPAKDSEGGHAEALADLMAMLNAAGSGEDSAEPTFTAVIADSPEQFYGTWELSRVAVGSLEMPMEMLAMLGIEASGQMTLSENTISGMATFNDGTSEEPTSKEAEVEVAMAMADGALSVTFNGETLVFQLTDAGELACVIPDAATLFFTAADQAAAD